MFRLIWSCLSFYPLLSCITEEHWYLVFYCCHNKLQQIGGLNNIHLLSHSSVFEKSSTNLRGLRSRSWQAVGRTLFFSRSSKGEPTLLPFSLLNLFMFFDLWPPSSTFKANIGGPNLSHIAISLVLQWGRFSTFKVS